MSLLDREMQSTQSINLFEVKKRERAMIFFSRFKEAHNEEEKINILVDMMTYYDKNNAQKFQQFCMNIYKDRAIYSRDCKLIDKIQELELIIKG